jgi:hypothetical protein
MASRGDECGSDGNTQTRGVGMLVIVIFLMVE